MPDSSATHADQLPPQPVPQRRRWWFPLAAVLLGLSTFPVAEAAFVLFDVGRPGDYEDPFVGFSEVRPLFELDRRGERYRIPRSRRSYFSNESFAAGKGPGEIRAFCLGGSTVLGHPYSKETSFTTWLELSLQTADPNRTWDIVNCGGVSYASYREVPILKECLGYAPDLFVICTGHNEFLEDRSYPELKRLPRPLTRLHEDVSQSRTYNLLRAGLEAARSSGQIRERSRTTLNTEVTAILDYKGGLETYERDEAWQAGVIAHFEQNLRGMLALARQAGVPVILVLPPSNLSGSPPFKSEHRAGLTADELQAWNSLFTAAQQHYRTDPRRAIELLQQAARIDEQYAALHFELGQCYEAVHNWASARRHFIFARDLDICPLRLVSRMEEILRDIADDTGTPFLDAHQLLESRCPNGILGDGFLVDHVHPSIEGHQVIARALLDLIAAQGFVVPRQHWEQQLPPVFKQQIAELPDTYFERGQIRLENLRAWSQGRATVPPHRRTPRRSGRSSLGH